jgi:hypothetical protein|tara:strand:- start:1208 stop:1684 length:477 start_codon:yes stop_codon:yes gene_type:complete
MVLRDMVPKKIVLALLSFTLLFSSTGYAQSVGVVKTLLGDVQLIRAGEFIKVGLGDEVFIDDALHTDNNSSVGILFNDNTRIGAGPNTRFSIDSYHFDNQSQQGQADLSIVNGTLALVGGQLTAKRLDAVKVHTPTTTLTASCSTLSVKVDPLTKEAP